MANEIAGFGQFASFYFPVILKFEATACLA
jgi:hypothetical protein